MEREDIENSLKVLSHIVDDDFIITVDEARKIIGIDGETIEVLQAKVERLQAQLPKLGEWIWDDKRCIYVCSVCGSPKVRENMDRQIIKEQAYCYSCGAKMEVQE